MNPVASFTNPVASFMNPVASFMNPVASFMNPVASFTNPVATFLVLEKSYILTSPVTVPIAFAWSLIVPIT